MRKLRFLNGYDNLHQKLLGDDLTFQIINGDSGDGDVVDEKYSPQKVGHFDTQSNQNLY